MLNFTIKALKAPQYNIHRFGIFFTETPKHADILIVLGPLNKKMKEPLLETINQMPKEYGIIIINEESNFDENIENLSEHRQMLKLLEKQIDVLPHKLKTALILFAIEDHSQEECARILGVTPKTVETRVYRARKTLLQKLSEKV